MKLFVSIIVCLYLVTGAAFAGSLKKYAGEFLALGAGSRILGMGGAGTAMVGDVTAGYWNPAGLTEAKGFQVQFMHSKQFISSIQNNYLAASHEMRDGQVLAVSLLYLTVNDIKDSRKAYNIATQRVDPSKVNLFNTGDYVFLASYARPYTDRLHAGLNVKTIYRDYETESALGLGFDIGMKYHYSRRLTFGLMLRDVTTTMMAWSTGEKEFITPSLRLGARYLFEISRFNLTFQPATDLNILFENRDYASQFNIGAMSIDTFWGLEIAYNNLLAVRAGLDDLQRFNTGVGIRIPKIDIDYSFTAYNSELGDIHRISFHLYLERLF